MLGRGDNVVVLDNLSTGTAHNLAGVEGHPNFTVHVGSVLDESLLDDLVEAADVVVHLAAAVGVRLIVEEPMRSLRTNVRGADNVLDAAHRYRKKVLIASTSEVYGKNSGELHENADRIMGPNSVARWAYATAKSIDEVMAFAYWRERHVPTVVVRLFNTVGPRQTGFYGMVLPRLVSQALLGHDLTVYGDGRQSRCFCHVDDVVRGLLQLAAEPRAVGEAFNLGTTDEISIIELAETVIRQTQSSSEIGLVPYDKVYGDQYEDLLRRVPDTQKVRNLVGWEPEHDLERIISDVASFVSTVGPETVLSG